MGWLTSAAIRSALDSGAITIDPFEPAGLNPISYDYRLGDTIKRLVSSEIDLLADEEYEDIAVGKEGVVLEPGECYLGHSMETLGSRFFASMITGRSSLARKFVTNHISSGLIDIGFKGQITLEIVVQRPTRIYPHMPFGQIYWFTVQGDLEHQYDGVYNGQVGPTPSRGVAGRRDLGPNGDA